MPLYEYKCTSCNFTYDKIQKFTEAEDKICPQCGELVIRPLNKAYLNFKGDGWYVTDYQGK